MMEHIGSFPKKVFVFGGKDDGCRQVYDVKSGIYFTFSIVFVPIQKMNERELKKLVGGWSQQYHEQMWNKTIYKKGLIKELFVQELEFLKKRGMKETKNCERILAMIVAEAI